MDKFFEQFGNRFIGFFTRSVAPSSVFFILLFLVDYLLNNEQIFDEVFCILSEINQLNKILFYSVLVLIFLSYGYINQIFSQFLDNRIKGNYELDNLRNENFHIDEYIKLREKVKKKAEEKYSEIFSCLTFNDYNAYQVLGKKFNPKSSYVDEVKAIHTLYIAVCMNIIIFSLFFEMFLFLGLPIIFFLFFFENIVARDRYFSRNKKMYINFLFEENNDIKEKELKIKSLKVEIDE